MILEAIITTENENRSSHVSAIGPHVDRELKLWTLKPFSSSKTFANLRRENRCVIHVVDNIELLVNCVVGLQSKIETQLVEGFGYILPNACRAFALELHDWEIDEPRCTVQAKAVSSREFKPFFGWNRAMHAILELAISATRIDMLPEGIFEQQMAYADLMVKKTGGDCELRALNQLQEFVVARLEAKLSRG